MRESKASGVRQQRLEARTSSLVAIGCRLLRTEGWSGLQLERVASEAGVTRRTVYNRFGSKAGLVAAVVEGVFGSAKEEADPSTAASLDDVLEVLAVQVLRRWTAERALLRRIYGAATLDADVAKLVAARERKRRSVLERVVRRLAAEAGLAPGLTEEEAIRAAVSMTSFQTYDALAGRDGGEASVARVLVRMLSSLRADFAVAQPVKRALRRG